MNSENPLPPHLRTKLLEAVMEFMSRCGTDSVGIREAFDSAMTNLIARKNGDTSSNQGLYVQSQNLPAQLLRAWHRDARYIDHEAQPRELPLSRGTDSLFAAIKRIDPSVDPRSVVDSMRTAGLVRRTARGRYLPTAESAIVGQLHPLLVEHVTKLISRLISTVSRNIDPTKKSLTLIDRHAYTSNLSRAERSAFAEFTRSHGMAYLQSIDDWLERRKISRSDPPRRRSATTDGVDAGVYLFAYIGDEEATTTPKEPFNAAKTKRGRR